MFNPEESDACQRLIDLALAEDLGERGDVTSQATIPAEQIGTAAFRVKAIGVLAGLPAAESVARAVDQRVTFEQLKSDGDRIAPGDTVARLRGPMRSILAAERTALNFLQHLSGIATQTRRFVNAVAGTRARILDTRKTLPGWRLLAKYAVRCGGGHNHRLGLFDGMLIKDNHLAAAPRVPAPPEGGTTSRIAVVVAAAKERYPELPVEIEIDALDQLDAALAARPAIVLLDNMAPSLMYEAVKRRDGQAPEVLLEASGGITLANVRAVAAAGVDRISIGALTHSAPALDIALDYEA